MLITLNPNGGSCYTKCTIEHSDISEIIDGTYKGHESRVVLKSGGVKLVEGSPSEVRDTINKQLGEYI